MAEDRITNQSSSAPRANREHPLSDATSQRLQRGALLPLSVFLAAGFVYGSLFCHVESIPTAVGANLVPAERILKGEVPYRDFYKIQTPGILLINAALFKMFGTSLLTAMTAVLVFKVLTITLVFICARLVSDWKLALVATLLSMVWIAPGGPFRSAPVQFEMLFVVSAIWFTLRWMSDGRPVDILLAGLAVGMVAVFKQNVGLYSAVALAASVFLKFRSLPRSLNSPTLLYRQPSNSVLRTLGVASLGVAVPLAAMATYLASQGALGEAVKVFLKGPGEHLQSRFTGYPFPKYAAPIIAAALLGVFIARWLVEKYPRRRGFVLTLLLVGATLSALLVSPAAVNNSIYWFAPSLFVYAIWKYYSENLKNSGDYSRGDVDLSVLSTLLLFSIAAYGEVFPRSVRGLVIDTMPPAFILLAFLCRRRNLPGSERSVEKSRSPELLLAQQGVVLGAVSVVLVVFAARTVGPSYFSIGDERGLHLKADTELNFDRGRGVYLPAKRARDVNAAVELIHSRVEPGGYVFAHSLDTTSYYFLADRNSPTAATLWNDTGTNDAERARTIDALREKQVHLVLTSEQALAGERYGPLLDVLRTDFHETTRIGQIIFLERNFQSTSKQ